MSAIETPAPLLMRGLLQVTHYGGPKDQFRRVTDVYRWNADQTALLGIDRYVIPVSHPTFTTATAGRPAVG